ncbi:unnamed protein product [Paramecium octaurelia]|uniref:Uncharacterized protein n=1 Tax=Paramecium octaurelia TaxID=43137 RepID=A0A8S1VVA3_PAROT|nr:unnamed protein product [Paramecium octaurelia]
MKNQQFFVLCTAAFILNASPANINKVTYFNCMQGILSLKLKKQSRKLMKN